MPQLSNTPQKHTPIRLEQRKSYSLGLWFRALDPGKKEHNVDLTGSVVKFVVAQPKHKGGAVVITKNAVLQDPLIGLARLDLQASELDLAVGEYPYSATLYDAQDYSIVFLKGVFIIEENPDPDDTNVYVGEDPDSVLHVRLTHDNLVVITLFKGLKGDQGEAGTPGQDGEDGEDGAPGTNDYNDLINKPTSMPPSGAAGGVLGGTYPNPTFATDMATQAELDVLTATVAGKAPTSHTHPSTQITDFTEAVQDVVGAFLAAGTGISVTYDDTGNVATITALGGGGGSWDGEQTRDTIGAALIGTGNITVTVNDAGDTITISTTATVNDTDANLRARSTHTGQQLFSTLSDGTEAVQDIVGAFLAAGAGITVTYNDAGNVCTIASTITQYTDEMARDAIGAALVEGSNIDVTVNDAGDTITIAVTGLDAYAPKSRDDVPSYAPTTLIRPYDARLNAFNWRASTTRKLSYGKARAQNGGVLRLGAIGDSLFIGSDGVNVIDANAIPRVAAHRLSRHLGVPDAGGFAAVQAATSSKSDRWSTTGTVDLTGRGYIILSAGATLTYVAQHPGDKIDVFYSNLSPNFSFTIDGGSAINVTPTGADTGAVNQQTTTEGMHTVVITAATNGTIIHGVRQRRSWGVQMDNLARGGTRAADTGGPTVAWTDLMTTNSIYHSLKQNVFDNLGLPLDAMLVLLGANDAQPGSADTAANFIEGMTVIRNWMPDTDFIMVRAYEVPATNATLWNEYCFEQYELAETLDCPLIDIRHRFGDVAALDTAGLIAADDVHPVMGFSAEMGRVVGDVLGGADMRDVPIVRSQAYLTANPTLPNVPNDSLVLITP